ncbi:MAG: elongation factor G [Candidatus Omnitrophica bacterium]|nr:elongation factor G [Candidatus Omnitrophota bacterium]
MSISSDKIRNSAIIGHSGCGKTSIDEALLYNMGVTTRLGEVDNGNTISDYMPMEVERKISINATITYGDWKEHRLNIIDTPGYDDFQARILTSLSAVDSAILVLNAVSGVEVGTLKVWKFADTFKLPLAILVNRLDKDNADFENSVAGISEKFSIKAIPVSIPIGSSQNFEGVIDLIAMKALFYQKDGKGKFEIKDIPDTLQDAASKAREKLVEAVAESSDELIEKYLNDGQLSEKEIQDGLKISFRERKIFPVVACSAALNIGLHTLLDLIVNSFPSPLERGSVLAQGADNKDVEIKVSQDDPFCAYVFKLMSESHVGDLTFFRIFSGKLDAGSPAYNSTRRQDERLGQLILMQGKNRQEITSASCGEIVAVAKLKATVIGDTLTDRKNPVILKGVVFPQPVVTQALIPKTKKDQEKLSSVLNRLRDEDPTIKIRVDPEFNQTLVSGMGEMHLEILQRGLKDKYGVEVTLSRPEVAYRETVRGKAEVQGKYKRQSGGRGQYGDVWITVEPLPKGEGFKFENKIKGGAIPSRFIPSVEKGLKEALKKGVLASYPVTDIKITLYDGTFHDVDSSDMAFQIAASMAFKKGVTEAKPVLLEPIMNLEVYIPEKYMGDITGDLNSRRGRIMGIDSEGGLQIVKASLPLAEVYRYSTDLRSMTQGQGTFTMAFSHYEEMQEKIAGTIISQRKPKE